MRFTRDAFAREEAPFKMLGCTVFSYKIDVGLEAGGWLSRDSPSRLVTEESLPPQLSKAFCSGLTV
jgi:hypothetical protein